MRRSIESGLTLSVSSLKIALFTVVVSGSLDVVQSCIKGPFVHGGPHLFGVYRFTWHSAFTLRPLGGLCWEVGKTRVACVSIH